MKKGILVAFIAILILLIGGFVFVLLHRTNTTSDKATSQTAMVTDKKSDETKTASMKEFCANDEKACFSYPETWTVSDANEYYNSDLQNTAVALTSPNGTKLVYHSGVTGLGGNCEASPENVITYDSVSPVPFDSSVHIVEAHVGQAPTSTDIGLSSSSVVVGKTNQCLLYFVFTSKTNPIYGVAFGTVNHSYNLKDGEEIKAILNSYHYL